MQQETTIHEKQLVTNSIESLALANNSIMEMINSRNLSLEGTLSTLVPVTFPSRNKEKAFRRSMGRIISKATMKNANSFLSKLSKYNGEPKASVTYSAKEKAIQSAKKDWKIAQQKSWELRDLYKAEKGNFYKK